MRKKAGKFFKESQDMHYAGGELTLKDAIGLLQQCKITTKEIHHNDRIMRYEINIKKITGCLCQILEPFLETCPAHIMETVYRIITYFKIQVAE
jgi:hypothetical protein